MTFHWNFFIEAHTVSIPSNEEWHLGCMLDDDGMPCIFLQTANSRYMVANGFEYLHGHEELGLSASHISRYYYEVVKKIYALIESYAPANIDICAVKAEVLPPFLDSWRAFGYWNEDDEPLDMIYYS